MPSEISPAALGISISEPDELRSKNEQSEPPELPDLPVSPQALGIEIPEAKPTAEPESAVVEPPKAPFTGFIPSTMATLKPQKVDEFGRPVDESGKPLYGLDEPKFGPEVDEERPLVISTDKSKPNYIKRAVTKLSDMLGIDYEPKLSDEARAQAVVQLMAREEGVPLHEYRQSPELIEQAASSLVNAATFGVYPSLRESLTGEIDYEPTDTSGYVGYALGSLGGMMLGPFRAAETTLRPIMRYIPRAAREERLAARILKESLHDAAILGTASGMMAVGEAGKETKFSDIASNIWNSTVSGTLTGTLFGLSRGLFPADGVQTGYRLMTGLTALNAQRAMESGANPFTDRPVGEVLFDIALDSLFLYKALPGRRAEKVAEDVARISDKARDIKSKGDLLESIPDEAIKKAQENIVNVEKQQLELEKQNVAGEIMSDVAVAEEISKQKNDLAKKKTIPKRQVEPQALETAEAEFVSKKGNRYYKINGSWYSSDGIEITNNFVIKAAEKYGKPREAAEAEPEVVTEAEPAKPVETETVEEIKPEAVIPEAKPVETEPAQAEPLRSKIEQTEQASKAKKPRAKKPKAEVPKPADVDMIAGEEKPFELKGENSPFFQDRETTEIHKKLFAERSKSVSEDIELFTQKLINDVNRWYHGEDVDITAVRNALSEFSARGAEARMQFVSGSDHFEWHQMVKEAAEWARSLERKSEVKKGEGTTLYSGVDPIKAISDMVELAKPFVGEFFRSLKAKEFDPAYALKRLKADTVKAFVDQQEPLLKYIRKNYPEAAEQLIAKQRAAVTGKGYGKEVYDQIYAEVYKGKSKRMVDLINMLSLATRFNAIYSYRSEKSYKHQPGYSAKSSSALFELSNLLKNLNDAQLKVLRKKVPVLDDIYKNYTAEEIAEAVRANEVLNEWHRKMVDDLVEVGRHSKEEGELLKKHDYRRFRSIRIDNIFDLSYSAPLKGETIKFTNSGVQALGGGSTKMLEPDYRNVLAEQTARVYGTIANEIAKREWKKFAEEHANNGIVSLGSGRPEGWSQINVKLKGEKPIYYSKSDINKDANLSKLSQRELYEYYKQHPEDKRFVVGTGEPSPKGWSSMPYFEDGIKKKLYFHPDVVDYLVTRSHDISPRLAKILRIGTLAPLTRSLAVSTSPVWATFVGLPMDFFHTLWTARTWEADRRGIRLKTSYPFYEVTKGKFKSVYSPFNPLDSLMLGKDIASVIKDIYSKGPFYKALMKHGMAMPWLSMREARYTRGLKQPGGIDKIIDALGYHGKSLEVAVRAAVAKRVLMRDAKKRGITFDEAMKDSELMYRAVHAARDRMDYNQGGWVVKALDQSGFMFLNAGILGARTFWRTAVDNPVNFFMRASRVGITASGITAAIWLMYPEIAKQMVSEESNEKDLKIPIFPDKIKVYDKGGNEGVFYFKLRMDPGQAFLYRVFEALTQTYLYDAGLIDQEPDYEKLVGTLKRLGPVGISLPPHLQFWIDYVTNYSWWRGRMMYTEMGGRKLPWPESKHEGEFDVNVSQLAKDVGRVTGLSPKRLSGSAGNVFPQNNEFVWLFNQVYNQTLSDVPDEVAKEHWLISLADVPGVDRVFGISWSGSRIRDIARDIETEEDIESIVRHGKLEFMAKNYYWYEYGSEAEIDRFIDSFEDPNIRRSLETKRGFISRTANLPNRDTWVSTFYMSPEGKARMMYKVYDGNLVEIDKMLDRLLETGYLSKDSLKRFYAKIDELRSQQQ